MEEVRRIYSEEDYFVGCQGNLVRVDGEGCFQETLVLGKISKQINENNKFKLENKIQVFHVEKM